MSVTVLSASEITEWLVAVLWFVMVLFDRYGIRFMRIGSCTVLAANGLEAINHKQERSSIFSLHPGP